MCRTAPDPPRACMTSPHPTESDQLETPPRPRTANVRKRVMLALLALVAAGVAALMVTSSIVEAGPASVLPGFGHDGEQTAQPDEDAISEGLSAATGQLHAHLNWLIWGPSQARLSPTFADLADRTIAVARDDGEDEIADLVTRARDLLIHDDEARAAHDLLQEAERIANGGVPSSERYEPTPDPETVDG
jgi:hypothetical protein